MLKSFIKPFDIINFYSIFVEVKYSTDMTQIILKGNLDIDLTRIGLKPGMVVFAQEDKTGTTGAMYFTVHYKGFSNDCVVWPENYDCVEMANVINWSI